MNLRVLPAVLGSLGPSGLLGGVFGPLLVAGLGFLRCFTSKDKEMIKIQLESSWIDFSPLQWFAEWVMVLPAPKWWKLILVFWGSDQFGLTFCWSNSQISSYQWRLQFVFIRIFRTACQAIHNGHLRRWPSALQPGHHRLPQQIQKRNLIAGYCKILKEPMWFEKLHDEVGYNWLWWILPVRFWKVAMTVKACCWMLSTCSCELQSKIGHDWPMKQDQDKTHLII